MFFRCESRTCISCRSSSILPADAHAKLDTGPRHLRGFLGLADVLRLHAFPALGYLVGNPLALFKGAEPGALYVGVVDENVSAPVVRGDEAVTPFLAESLDCSLSHLLEPTSLVLGLPHNKCYPP
jgi:hypothetical protein